MASIKRSHHVVPQFYLRRFADENKNIFQIDKTDSSTKIIAVKKATVIQDLYLVDAKDGSELDFLEDFFGRIESNAARAFKNILEYNLWPLDDRPREHLALWIVAQFLRTPRMRNRLMNELHQLIESMTLDEAKKVFGSSFSSDSEFTTKWQEAMNYYKALGPQTRNSQAIWFASLLKDPVRQIYLRNWHLVRFDSPVFITSDEPILLVNEDVDSPIIMNPGSADIILVPLDRSTILIIHPSRATIDGDIIVDKDKDFAIMANIMMAAHSDRFIFEHPDDKIHQNLPTLLS